MKYNEDKMKSSQHIVVEDKLLLLKFIDFFYEHQYLGNFYAIQKQFIEEELARANHDEI
jgi:hypothetical protein